MKDLESAFNDPRLIEIFKQIIKNPIETPKGYSNPASGIALRGPLSQFFSALYLKPLYDAFAKMKISYLRYQDDIIILCDTKRQLNRCKRRMMEVLHERGLRLSKKKTRIGKTDKPFHFLGIQYPGTQPLDNTCMTLSCHDSAKIYKKNDLLLGKTNQVNLACHQQNGLLSIVPH